MTNKYTAGREEIVRVSMMYGVTRAEANRQIDELIAEHEARQRDKPWWRRVWGHE